MNAAALAALLGDTGAACMPAPVLKVLAAAHGNVCAGASPECKDVRTMCMHCLAPVCDAHVNSCDACLAGGCVRCSTLGSVTYERLRIHCHACPGCRERRARTDIPGCDEASVYCRNICRSICRTHVPHCFVCKVAVCHIHGFRGPCDNTFLCAEHAPTCPKCKRRIDCTPGVVDNRILSHDRTRYCTKCFEPVVPVLDEEMARTMRVLIAFGLGGEE